MEVTKTNKSQPEGEIIRRLFHRTVGGVMLAATAATISALIDGIVTGKYLGTDSMAAYGLVSPLFCIVFAISGVLSGGAQVICANHLGGGRIDHAKQVFSVCMCAVFAVSVLLTVVLLLCCEPLCAVLGAKGEAAHLLPLARDYLLWVAPGILPAILIVVLGTLLRLDGGSRFVTWGVLVMIIIDAAGDFLVALVFHAGMGGMGLTTSLSYWAAAAVMLLHFRRPDRILRFSVREIKRGDLLHILRTGAPTAIGSASTTVRYAILNLIMVQAAGAAAVAALSVRNTMHSILSSLILGVGTTTTIIAGMVYGEEDRAAVRQLMQTSLRYALTLGSALGAMVFAFAPGLVMLFVSGQADSVEMSELAKTALRLYAFGLPFYGINMVWIGYLQGINRLRLSNLLSLLDNLVYVVLAAILLVRPLGTAGIWLSFAVGEVLVVITFLVAAMLERKKETKGAVDYLFLPEDFGVPEQDIFACSVRTKEELMAASESLRAFIDAHGVGKKERMLIPLFVEEMGMNVIEHGFTKDERSHSLDLRVLTKEGDWLVRLRDNCLPFDPKQRLKLHQPDDPAANIGIRIVCGMAKDVQYVNAMELNNLIITV